MVRGLAEARGLRLELDIADDLPVLQLDRTRIRQVLLNLLSNATRFTDKGWIRVQIHRRDSDVLVTVADTGRGIDPGRLARAFEAFSQLEDGQARQGSGLGLAVSKRFVELHGGTMWIESEPGCGTQVHFTLPVTTPVTEARGGRPVAGSRFHPRTGKPTVVVLHDDPRILPLLRRHIQGYDFLFADTVAQAQQVFQGAFPTAVMIDSAWAETSRADVSELRLPPYVSVIRCSLPSARRLGSLLGAVDFIPKPVTRDDLAQALARLSAPVATILVVDDDPHVVRLLKRMLRAEHRSWRILEAFGGREALEVVQTTHPDVMLLDLVMPDMDGYAVLESMTKSEDLSRTRVIIISALRPEQESTSLTGRLTLAREAGFSLTETLGLLQAALSATTPSAMIASTSVAQLPGTDPGSQAS